MIDDETRSALPLHYRPARTVIRFDGTVTTTPRFGEAPAIERSSTAAISAEADPDTELTVTVDESWRKDQQFQLDLAVDQRLAGATHDSTGVGAQLIGAALSIVAVAAKVFLLTGGGGTPVVEPDQELQELQTRRDDFAARVDRLQVKLKMLLSEDRFDADALKALTDALTAARLEVTTIEAAIDARWIELHPPTAQSLAYVVGTDQLPRRDAADEVLELHDDDLRGAVKEAARRLGVVAVLIGSQDSKDSPPDAEDALHYRVPQRVEIAVYESDDVGPFDDRSRPTAFRLRSVQPAWVVDSRSAYRSVPLKHKLFGNGGAGLKFGDAGTLVQVTNKETSALGALATAVSGAPATVATALENTEKITKAFPAPADPELAALKSQVARKELEAKLVKAKKTIAGGTNGAEDES